MDELLKKMALCFSAGGLGGLTNSLAVWLAGLLAITTSLGVGIAPTLTPDWLYPRIVWGGLWGFLFLLPVLAARPYLRGLLWSLGPSAVQLFIVFPLAANKGVMGLDLGLLTPLFVLLFNAVWGLTAAFFLTLVGHSQGRSQDTPVAEGTEFKGRRLHRVQ